MSPGILLVAFLAGFVILVLLKNWRQRRGSGPTPRGSGLIRTGVLELQSFLEPEKKVEILMQKEDKMIQEQSGDPPQPGLSSNNSKTQ